MFDTLKPSEMKRLINATNKFGPAKVALTIGERDTQSLHRWIKNNRVPAIKVASVRDAIVSLNKMTKRGIQ